MTPVSPEELRRFVVDSVVDGLAALGLDPDDVPDDFDLLLEGVIDSFGLIEMIGAIEERYGVDVDFDDLPAESFTVVGPLCRYIAEKSAGSHSGVR